MARTLNKVMLIGNVGNDPELKHTPNGIPVASFRLATSENRKDKDGIIIEHTDWHTIIAWRGLADIVNKFVQRGSRLFIEGKIQTRSFDDKLGNHRRVVEILADTILLLDGKRNKDDDDSLDNFEDEHFKEDDTDIDSFFDHHYHEMDGTKKTLKVDTIPF
jgi:single-strand DNA-binding protein